MSKINQSINKGNSTVFNHIHDEMCALYLQMFSWGRICCQVFAFDCFREKKVSMQTRGACFQVCLTLDIRQDLRWGKTTHKNSCVWINSRIASQDIWWRQTLVAVDESESKISFLVSQDVRNVVIATLVTLMKNMHCKRNFWKGII